MWKINGFLVPTRGTKCETSANIIGENINDWLIKNNEILGKRDPIKNDLSEKVSVQKD